jgi:hypothetical protein
LVCNGNLDHLFVESTVLILYEIYDFSFNQSLVSIVNIFSSEFYSMHATGVSIMRWVLEILKFTQKLVVTSFNKDV